MAYELVTSIAQLEKYVDKTLEIGEDYGLDTENDGLDTRRLKPVGVSLSCEDEGGVYVPTGHLVGRELNLPLKEVGDQLKRLSSLRAALYNAKYDKTVFQVHYGWTPDKFIDVLDLVYLKEPDRMVKNLKAVAKSELDFDMETFDSLFTPAEVKSGLKNIATKHPERCVSYACADADATRRLGRKYAETEKKFEFPVKVDMKLVDIVRGSEHNGGMELDSEYINRQIKLLGERIDEFERLIHQSVGKEFTIASSKQLGDALFEYAGIDSPGLTKSGQHKTDAETLEKLAEVNPVVGLVVCYRKLVKARNDYFLKLDRLVRLDLKPRFSFNMFSAPTFRFSAPGGDPLVDGMTGINVQAVSGGKLSDLTGVNLSDREATVRASFVEDIDEADMLVDMESDIEESLPTFTGDIKELPWVVSNEQDEQVCVRTSCKGCNVGCRSKGISVVRSLQKGLEALPSVRSAFKAPDGWILLSFDYDRQELVVGANMSNEPVWLKALAANEDLHVIAAAKAYGLSVQEFMALPKGRFKKLRGIGKILNFASFYGATASTLARKADIPLSQAEMVFNGFKDGLPTLFGWMEQNAAHARKFGYVETVFGRRRSLEFCYKDPKDRRMHAFGDRSATNTRVQGSSADITRVGMVKAHANVKDAGFTIKQARFVMQVHDELMFMARREHAVEVARLVKKGMEFKIPSFKVQLTAGLKYGQNWGKLEEAKDFEVWCSTFGDKNESDGIQF